MPKNMPAENFENGESTAETRWYLVLVQRKARNCHMLGYFGRMDGLMVSQRDIEQLVVLGAGS